MHYANPNIKKTIFIKAAEDNASLSNVQIMYIILFPFWQCARRTPVA